MTLEEFLAQYAPEGHRRVVEVDLVPKDEQHPSPFVVVRHGKYVAVLSLIGNPDHLCIDVHSFVDEEKVTGGVFGLSSGRRSAFPETGTTSHRWSSASLVAVLIGEQGTDSTTAQEATE